MSSSFQSQSDVLQTFPEQKYFQNCIVIGELPVDISIELVFSFFHDIPYWKKGGRQIISDLVYPHMKAVVVSYDNEKLAHLCAFRVSQAISRTSFTLYDGNFLFHHCKHLDEDCDPRSRNVSISGFDTNVPNSMYLDLFRVFGTVNYFEFRIEGDIPKARIEYSRATSAFAAVLFLKGTLSIQTLVSMEIPLFPVEPIGTVASRCHFSERSYSRNGMEVPILSSPSFAFSENCSAMNVAEKNSTLLPSPILESTGNQSMMAHEMPLYSPSMASCEGYFAGVFERSPIQSLGNCEGFFPSCMSTPLLATRDEFIEGRFLMLNTLNCHSSEGCYFDCESSSLEVSGHQQMEDFSMEAVSFEISRKRQQERGVTRQISRGKLDKVKEESLKMFLQAAKRKVMFYHNAGQEATVYSNPVIKQKILDSDTQIELFNASS